MILLTSGAFLDSEFADELGILPPSFLPLGNKRLYEFQIPFLKKLKKKNERIYLSIPKSYELDEYDEKKLFSENIILIRTKENLTLGKSIYISWNKAKEKNENLVILHGDTYFKNLKKIDENTISVHSNLGFYKRALLTKESNNMMVLRTGWANYGDYVLSGIFNIQNTKYFFNLLTKNKFNFIKSIKIYNQSQNFKILKRGDWLDFGHINNFFRSRTKITSQRAFNNLSIDNNIVTKYSKSNIKKIKSEAFWYDSLPNELKIYTPSFLGSSNEILKPVNQKIFNYKIEYLQMLPLSELFVFCKVDFGTWREIIDRIKLLLINFSSFKNKKLSKNDLTNINNIYLIKTIKRLNEFESQSGFDINKKISLKDGIQKISLKDMAIDVSRFINKTSKKDISVIHGDLCFSNLFFDRRSGVIKCIDPRGLLENGESSIYGDIRYDLAKLYHSVIGLYDFLISNRYSLNIKDNNFDFKIYSNPNYHSIVTKFFINSLLKSFDYDEKEILSITILLFLSMTPLHSDKPNLQKAFIANSLRLYEKLYTES